MSRQPFGRRINAWLDEAPGKQFTDNKWKFWFLPLCGFQLLNAGLTAAVFSAGDQLQNAMGAVVLGVGALLAWLAVAFLHYSDSRDRRLARGVSALDSVTLVCVLAHFTFLLWTFGHLKTLQRAEADYERAALTYNEKAEKISADNAEIAKAAQTIATETTKAERLRNDTMYQARKAAEAGARISGSRQSSTIAPSLSTAQVELERPTKPEDSSAAFLARWDLYIRLANLAELLLAAVTLIYIRNRSAKTNDGGEILHRSRRLEAAIAVPAFETTRSDTVSEKRDDTAPAKKATQGVNREGLRHLREVLKLIGFHSRTHFKVDTKADGGYLWIRQFKSTAGEPETIASARAKLNLLDSAVRLEQEKFRIELTAWLQERGFEV